MEKEEITKQNYCLFSPGALMEEWNDKTRGSRGFVRHFLGAEGNKLIEGIQDVWVKVLSEEQRAECLAVPLHLCVVLCGRKGR